MIVIAPLALMTGSLSDLAQGIYSLLCNCNFQLQSHDALYAGPSNKFVVGIAVIAVSYDFRMACLTVGSTTSEVLFLKCRIQLRLHKSHSRAVLRSSRSHKIIIRYKRYMVL